MRTKRAPAAAGAAVISVLVIGGSALLVPRQASAAPLGDCGAETGLTGRSDVVFCEPWESSTWWQNGYVGDGSKTSPSPAKAENVWATEIVSDGCVSGSCLRVNMKKGVNGALAVHWPLAAAGLAPEQLYFRYYLRLAPGWTPTFCDETGAVSGAGGKFPGPADVRTNADPSGQCGNGGETADGINCWSARGAFRTCDGACETKPNAVTRIGGYVYFYGQEDTYGSDGLWDSNPHGQSTGNGGSCASTPNNMLCGIGDGGVLVTDRWYAVEWFVKMNTPGKADGVMRGWVDGVLSYEKTNMIYRIEGHDDLHVRTVWLNVYTGGLDTNCEDKSVYLDQMVIATDAEIGPLGSVGTGGSSASGGSGGASSTAGSGGMVGKPPAGGGTGSSSGTGAASAAQASPKQDSEGGCACRTNRGSEPRSGLLLAGLVSSLAALVAAGRLTRRRRANRKTF